MSETEKQRILKHAVEDFNHDPSIPVPPKLEQTIRRKYLVDDAAHQPPLSSKRVPGQSVEEFHEKHKSINIAAEWNELQLAEIEGVESKTPEEQRVELRRQLLNGVNKHADPGLWNRYNEELQIAEAELNTRQEKDAAEAREAERRALVESNEQWQNAVKNADLIVNAANESGDQSEILSATMARRQLDRSTPETVASDAREHFEFSAKFEDRQALRLRSRLEDAAREAAGAVEKYTDAAIDVADAEHRANQARFDAGGGADE